MSHELTIRQNGTVEMAYAGATPWHGLGQKVEAGASIEAWLAAAGMDWKILRSKVRYSTERDGGGLMTMDDKHVLFRSDTHDALSVVSDAYKTVQPREVLEFFRDLTETAGMTIETAGTLFGGKRFWALASTGESAAIADPRDRVKGYLLLSTSCDGSMATEGRYTTICVVCNNTLTAARGDDAAKVRVTHRSQFDAKAAKKELGIERAHERFAETMDAMRRLAATPISKKQVIDQTIELVKPGALASVAGDSFADLLNRPSAVGAESEFDKLLALKPVKRITDLVLHGGAIGDDLAGRSGTQWAWVNAVTQYVDHEARARSQDNRLASAWFGPGEALKERAYELAIEAAR